MEVAEARSRGRRIRRRPAVLLGGAALGLGLLVFLWARARPTSWEPLPVPNGYDDLVAAGRMIEPHQAAMPELRSTSVDPLGAATLKPFVEAIRPGLERARVGLGRDVRVPVEGSRAWIDRNIRDTRHLRAVGRALIAEGRVAEAEGRPARAADSYLDTVRVGQAAQRGGVMMNAQVGIAITHSGLEALRALAPRLPAEACRRVVRALEAIDRRAEPFGSIVRRESAFMRANLREAGPVAPFIEATTGRFSALLKPALQATDRASRRDRLDRLQLRLDLAARAYRLEHGAPPQGPAALVPEYLSAVPRDPRDGRPLDIITIEDEDDPR